MSVFFKTFVRENYFALLTAILVGLIYVGPQLIFIFSLGDQYQGIPMMHTANEDFYLARIQEILDSHPAVSSHAFFEYKNQWPMQSPTVELLYALPSLLFGVSLASVLIASKFVLPAILFLVVYFLIRKLTDQAPSFLNKANAIAGALMVTLGYDLVDYRNVWLFLIGQREPGGGFLLWSRPINPVSGGIFLMIFLVFIWSIIQKTKWHKASLLGASVFLALMMGSYFFGWGLALSILSILGFLYLIKKEYQIIKNLVCVPLLALLLAAPYWYIVWQATKSPWYAESALRNGLFYTHRPLLNKFMIAVLGTYLIFVFVFSREKLSNFKDWHWMSLAFIFGSFVAYNQQIITGMTIWPYHFVSYTIPLGVIVLMTLLYNFLNTKAPRLLIIAIIAIASASLFYGTVIQASVYQRLFAQSVETQAYAPVLRWLNAQEKDCVVFVNETDGRASVLAGLIPAFTHCNVYASTWVHSLMPTKRSYHSYFAALKLREVPPDTINQYIKENGSEIVGYLFSNWKGLYNSPDFPDFSDPQLEQRIKEFPEQYREFSKKDFRNELEKYRLDYIVSFGKLNPPLIKSLKLEKVFEVTAPGIVVYTF